MSFVDDETVQFALAMNDGEPLLERRRRESFRRNCNLVSFLPRRSQIQNAL